MYEQIAIIREPTLELMKLTHESCFNFAHGIIKSGMILNGGAIVALPAIASMFNSDISKTSNVISIKAFLVIAVVAYLVGLFTAWSAGIIAYFAACRHNRHAVNTIGKIQNDHFLLYNFVTQKNYDEAMNPVLSTLTKDQKNYSILRLVGIVLCLISLFSFITGSAFSGWAFGEAAGLWKVESKHTPQHKIKNK